MRSIAVSIPPAHRILDLGCGTGWVLGEAVCQGEPFRVGVDISLTSLRSVKTHPVNPVCGDATRLPFADGAFDVIVSHVCLPYMNTQRALSEIFRVLAPGGSFLITVHNFRYLRQRFWTSLRRANWKDLIFCAYMASNGALNYLGLPQMHAWWRRSLFETVHTARGMHRAACAQGFSLVSTEHDIDRIFFAVTARKPNPITGHLSAAPGWSTYSELKSEVAGSLGEAPVPPKSRAASAGRLH